MSEHTTEFDPSRYLTKVSGSDYLEVKWRLLWLRQTHPNAIIDTTLISHGDQVALFKATIEIPTNPDGTGGGIGTGHGSEAYGDFRDYIEKAETKALGRALAALGFGTQFCNDFAFGADQNRVVDSPVALQRQMERRQQAAPPRGRNVSVNTVSDLPGPPRASGSPQAGGSSSGDQVATARQHGFIEAMTRELGMSLDELTVEVESSFGCSVTGLNRRDASVLIERLQQRRAERPTQQAAMLPNADIAERARQ